MSIKVSGRRLSLELTISMVDGCFCRHHVITLRRPERLMCYVYLFGFYVLCVHLSLEIEDFVDSHVFEHVCDTSTFCAPGVCMPSRMIFGR